jgi:hypothetical protein
MPLLSMEELRELAGIPERITRKQVIEAAKVLGLDAAKVVSIEANAECINVTVMPQPGWRMEVRFKIDGPPLSHLDHVEISGGY